MCLFHRRITFPLFLAFAVLAIVPQVPQEVAAAPGDRLAAVYTVSPAGDQGVTSEGLAALQQILQQRLGAYGITDANVQAQEGGQLLVDIPNTSDARGIIMQIGQVGFCEFVGSDAQLTIGGTITTSLGGPTTDTMQTGTTATTAADSAVYQTLLQGSDIADAVVQTDRSITPVPTITLTVADTAAQSFGDYTGAHTGQYISIVVDKRVLSSAMVIGRIDGVAVVQGTNLGDMRALAAYLHSGPLIIPLASVDTHIVPAAA